MLLPVKVSPNAENREHATVKLRNVLHTPKAICNIIGAPICDDYDVVLGSFRNPANAGTITLPNGTAVGFFTLKSRFQLRLSVPPVGPHVGPSPFEPGTNHIIRAEWPSSERQKWLPSPRTPGPMAAPDRPSAEERKWLNMHYGNEYKFLAAHRLRIRDEEERHEGLQVMRALMQHHTADTVGGLGYPSERLASPEGQWMKENYGNEYKFLVLHGLEIYKDEDRLLGLNLARAMMAADGRRALQSSLSTAQIGVDSSPPRGAICLSWW